MTDQPTAETETPMARALRLRKAAAASKPKPPNAGRAQQRQAAGMPIGASKPAMKK